MARKVSAVHFVGSVWKDRCSQPLTSESLARAEKRNWMAPCLSYMASFFANAAHTLARIVPRLGWAV